LLDLINMLDPEVRVIDSGPLEVSTTLGDVSGWCRLTVESDGTVTWEGHMHESSSLTQTFYAVMTVNNPSRPLIMGHEGTVHGTLGLGLSRDCDWHLVYPTDAEVRGAWNTLKVSSWKADLTVYDSDLTPVEALLSLGIITQAEAESGAFLLLSSTGCTPPEH
jgi:hypothetical protein